MPIATAQGKENAAAGYTGQALYMSLHTASPGTTGANEVTGGSPAYARKAITWTAGAVDGQYTATVPTFDVPAVTVTHVGVWTAATGGTFLDSVDVVDQTFGSQGTLSITSVTYTQS